MAKKNKSKSDDNTIARNRIARYDYAIEEELEVGIVLEGWEVKSLREKNLQLKESYVMVKNGELSIIGAHIAPLNTASTHIRPELRDSRHENYSPIDAKSINSWAWLSARVIRW